jgi:hypothetical protein
MNNFKQIKKNCKLKMKINRNTECVRRRKIIAGLDGCLCNKDNCNLITGKKPEDYNV